MGRPPRAQLLRRAAGARRIRLGYVSSDFGNHPLGRDFQHFFGFHDAEAFEVFAINIRRAADSTHWRSRIVEQVEHWVDLGSVGDEEAAATIRGLGLDVVFNLNGYTPGSRNRIFALRPAPIATFASASSTCRNHTCVNAPPSAAAYRNTSSCSSP